MAGGGKKQAQEVRVAEESAPTSKPSKTVTVEGKCKGLDKNGYPTEGRVTHIH